MSVVLLRNKLDILVVELVVVVVVLEIMLPIPEAIHQWAVFGKATHQWAASGKAIHRRIFKEAVKSMDRPRRDGILAGNRKSASILDYSNNRNLVLNRR